MIKIGDYEIDATEMGIASTIGVLIQILKDHEARIDELEEAQGPKYQCRECS